MKIDKYKLGFIGFGHLAQILCRSIVQTRLIPRSQILFVRQDPKKILEAEKRFGITSSTLQTVVSKSDLLVICVRPDQAERVLQAIAPLDLTKKMAISVMASVSLSRFEKILGKVDLIRAMPNIAVEVGAGMTVLSPGAQTSSELKSLTNILFASLGKTLELPESYMDIATAISGSGPAFVFSLIEAMAEVAEKKGVGKKDAFHMAAQTFLGASKMLLEGNHSIEDLKRQTASAGGTTEAGLKVFYELEVGKKLQDVINAAEARAKTLSGG